MDALTLAFYVAQFTTRWAAVPPPGRKVLYRPHELTEISGVPRRYLKTVLELLGWHRATRGSTSRTTGRPRRRTYYAPPGHRVPYPPLGRQPVELYTLFVSAEPIQLFPE